MKYQLELRKIFCLFEKAEPRTYVDDKCIQYSSNRLKITRENSKRLYMPYTVVIHPLFKEKHITIM